MFKQLFLFVAIISTLFACQSKSKDGQNQEQGNVNESKIPWKNSAKVSEAIDSYFNVNVYDKNKEALSIADKGSNIDANISKILKDSVLLLANNKGIVVVEMKTAKDENLLADYTLVWDENLQSGEDTLKGGFKVESVAVRKFKDEERYKWEKDGDFFIKK